MKKMLLIVACVVVSCAFYGCKKETKEDQAKATVSEAVDKADAAAKDAADKADNTTKDATEKVNKLLK